VRLFKRAAERCYIDIGPPGATTFIAGMGRSGTTWVADIVNHDHSYRILFEPLLQAPVRAAGGFAWIQYMDRRAVDPVPARAMERILSGRIRVGAVDRNHRGILFRRRIVKEIRCNLMLGWLRQIRPAMPIILVIRNPLAVAASWLRLAWGGPTASSPPDLDVMLSQEALLDAFPVIRRAMKEIDRNDTFERILLQWCILHIVPAQQLGPGDALILHYEDLVENVHAEMDRLEGYLGITIDTAGRKRVASRFASTNFRGRSATASRVALITDWREILTPAQVQRARDILALCEIDATGAIDHRAADNGTCQDVRGTP
jgi:hypothetical protein